MFWIFNFAASETESQNIFISARDSITVYDYDIQYFECSALFSSVLHNPRAFLADSALTATEYWISNSFPYWGIIYRLLKHGETRRSERSPELDQVILDRQLQVGLCEECGSVCPRSCHRQVGHIALPLYKLPDIYMFPRLQRYERCQCDGILSFRGIRG